MLHLYCHFERSGLGLVIFCNSPRSEKYATHLPPSGHLSLRDERQQQGTRPHKPALYALRIPPIVGNDKEGWDGMTRKGTCVADSSYRRNDKE